MDSTEKLLMDSSQAIHTKLIEMLHGQEFNVKECLELYKPRLNEILKEKLNFGDSTKELKDKIQNILEEELNKGTIRPKYNIKIEVTEEDLLNRRFTIRIEE